MTVFWNRTVHYNSVGSGTDYRTGWRTAFYSWDTDGQPKTMRSPCSKEPNTLFDVIEDSYVDIDKMLSGYASVLVVVGKGHYEIPETMIAGSIGIAAPASSSRATH